MSKGMRYANQVCVFRGTDFLHLLYFYLLLVISLFQALLSGCSAGGLASILHCDEFRELFPKNTKVKCLGDAGLFLDAYDLPCAVLEK